MSYVNRIKCNRCGVEAETSNGWLPSHKDDQQIWHAWSVIRVGTGPVEERHLCPDCTDRALTS